MRKTKKVLAFILSLSLFFSILPVQAMNFVETENVVKSDARKKFEEKTSNLYEELDKVEIMVEIDENAFRRFGKNYSGTELREELLIPLQISYSKQVNEAVFADLRQRGIQVDVNYAFELLVLGFSAKVSYKDALAISDLDYVKSVNLVVKYDRPEYTFFNRDVRMIHSREIVNQHLVNSKYKGEGTVVAVIDSGFDHTHPAFYISDEYKSKVKLTKEAVEDLVKKGDVEPGVYLSEKFPFGYDYFAGSATSIKEGKIESHGQHVSGTAAANKVMLEQGEFMGIAPEAQILAMRVFPDSGGTSDDIYVKAMEDAIKLRADSMNLSLGSSAGNLQDDSEALKNAMNKAADMGIVVAIAVGNDGYFGKTAGKPKATEPDYGIMAYPALTPRSLAVASYNNTKILQSYIVLTRNGKTEEIGYVQPRDSQIPFGEEDLEIVPAGIGRPEDIPEEVRGKYALIERGKITFTDKINNAAEKGAVGAIIYNHESGGNDFISMSAQGAKIPSASIRRDDALRILENASEYRAKFSKNLKAFASKTSGYISDFSNWGLTAEGDLKPEILAPGGNIYSTFGDGNYGNMSGTSMASPHVAGGILLVKSRVNADFPDYSNYQKYELVKNLLMSTATPHTNLDENVFSSPRNQGAGIMNLQGAVTSNVILLDKKTRMSKVNLGNVNDTFNFTVVVKNLKDKPATYRYKTYVLTDKVVGDYITLTPRLLTVVEGEEVTVNGEDEAFVTVQVDTAAFTEELTKKMPNGYFLEGFVVFESTDESNPQPNLSIPFLGFKGDFGSLQVVESSVYELAEEGRLPRYYEYQKDGSFEARDFTHFSTSIDDEEVILGQAEHFNPERPQFGKLVLSPNNDKKLDAVKFTFTLLRNASYLSAKLYKAEDTEYANPLGTVFEEDYSMALRKNYGDPRRPKSYTIPRDITIFNSPEVTDGHYKVVLESKSIIETAPVNKTVFDFYVDREAPTVSDLAFDDNTRVLSFQVEDTVAGVKEVDVMLTEGDKTFFLRKDGEGYRIPDAVELSQVKIKVTDFGYNVAELNVAEELSGYQFGSITTTATVSPAAAIVPNYKEKIVSADDENVVWKKNRLKEGKYKLYITDVSHTYNLLTPNPIEFEITADKKHVQKTLDFEKLEVRAIAIQIPVPLSGLVKVHARDVVTGKIIPIPSHPRVPVYVYEELPFGEYEIVYENVPQGYRLILYSIVNNIAKPVPGNRITVNAQLEEFTGYITNVVKDNERPLTINTVGLPAGEEVDYIAYGVHSGEVVENPTGLVRGLHVIYPKDVPAGYRPVEPFVDVYVKADDTEVNVRFAFEENPQGEATVTVTDNKDSFQDLDPEYVLVDAKAFLQQPDGITYELKDNPKVPYGNYIFTAKQDSYEEELYQMNVRFVTVDQENTVLDAVWQEAEERYNLSLNVELPEELSEVTLVFVNQRKEETKVVYQKENLNSQVVSLKKGSYDVVVKDLPEGYEVKENDLRFVHAGQGEFQLTIEKSSLNGLPEEYGFGRVFVEVRDQDDILITDVTTKVFHNDLEVDPSKALPYGNYEARIDEYDSNKYQPVEASKEVTINAANRLATVVLRVKSPVDKEKLAEVLDKAKQIDLNKYTPDSANALKQALESAQKVYDNADAKQSEVNAQVDKLTKAMEGLKVRPEPSDVYVPAPSTPSAPSVDNVTPSKPAPSDKDTKTPANKDTVIKDNKLPLADPGFADVKTSDWFAPSVAFVKERGLMKGVSQNEFKPQLAVTRGMVVTILHRLENKPEVSKEDVRFTDVKDDAYYAEAVKWASSEKLILGFGNGLFGPDQEITREQLAHILAKYASFKNKKAEVKEELNFVDKDSVSDFAKESTAWAKQVGLLTGKENNRLDPQGNATRAELAKVLQNLIEKVLESK